MLQLARDFLDFKDIETVLYRLRKESPDLPKMMVKMMKKEILTTPAIRRDTTSRHYHGRSE